MTSDQRPLHKLKLMFEWGGGTVWGNSTHTSNTFGVGPIEDVLPIGNVLKQTLADMTEWHDTALNWDYPPDPSPWPSSEFERFEKVVEDVLSKLRLELGPEYQVDYRQLSR